MSRDTKGLIRFLDSKYPHPRLKYPVVRAGSNLYKKLQTSRKLKGSKYSTIGQSFAALLKHYRQHENLPRKYAIETIQAFLDRHSNENLLKKGILFIFNFIHQCSENRSNL